MRINRNKALNILRDYYPLDSVAGAKLLVRLVTEIGYDAALTDKACIELARAHFGWGGASNQECVTCALTAQLRRETGHPAQGENPVTGRARQTPNLTDPR